MTGVLIKRENLATETDTHEGRQCDDTGEHCQQDKECSRLLQTGENNGMDSPSLSVCVCVSYSVVSDLLRTHGLKPARLLCPWDSPNKNTGVTCCAVLQGIVPTQELNLGLLHWGEGVPYH